MADSGQGPFVVGVGSSAGGIEALEGLFRGMPAATGMSFVLVAHLSPERADLLQEVVGRFTGMPVRRAGDGARLEPDHVYVIPPACTLELEGGRLRVGEGGDGTRRGAANPVDLFFTSLARDQGERAIGILLSGGGSDGTVGFRAIKEGGGLTLAQGADGSGPRHASVPGSAIAAGLADIVAPVEAMPRTLVAYARSFRATLDEVESASVGVAPTAGGAPDSGARGQICAILRDQLGHDFSGYKDKTFWRRVQRRMQVLQAGTLAGYLARLRQDPDEVALLFRDLLIGVTAFFRDGEAFEQLAATVLPSLAEDAAEGGVIRVWVPGCATGEEAYSVAMLLRERLDGQPNPPRVQVFATDIDERALAVARAGRYAADALKEVAHERLGRFFTRDAGWCVVSKEVRDMCIFSTHSLVRDPPFSRIDLISCRNLLIYLGGDLQAQVVPVFHYALRPGGYLFLGTSESVGQHGDLFAPLDKKHRIFRRRGRAPSRVRFPLAPTGPRLSPSAQGARQHDQIPIAQSLRREVDARVLERFAPAHVVVNSGGEVVYYSLRTGKYLEQPAGTPSRHLVAMARKGLPLELQAALQEAAETRRAVTRGPVMVETEDRVQPTSLTVEPFGDQEGEAWFLVLFSEAGPALTPEEAARGLPPTTAEADGVRLEAELSDTRERLQSTVEEYETSLEELGAANEELVSMNEELQSTNEELETSKEEAQSINEELQTVNQELSRNLDQLNQANADLANLLDSTRIAVVFLDQRLVIRSFTQAVTGIFSLIPGDVGRPLTDIAVNLDCPGLADDVRRAVGEGEAFERRAAKADGSAHYLVRILPYRGGDGAVGGALLTFVDITAPVREEERQRLLVHELNHQVRNMLAVVSAIASQTLARTPEPEAFAEAFLGRIHALARSHALLARDGWGDVALAEVLGGELEPHAGDGQGASRRVRVGGPPVTLNPKAALALGLVAHELATNAVKHGALRADGGRVWVSWAEAPTADGRLGLRLRWEETGAPAADGGAGPGSGFGAALVEQEVRHELGGTIEREFLPTGLRVTIDLPFDRLLAAGPADGRDGLAAAS